MLEVVRIFGVSHSAIRKWVKKYKEGGTKDLAVDERGRPQWKELSAKQERSIILKISNKQPEQLKFSFGLWTRENVGELIFREYGIRRSCMQIGRYLKEWGFTPQKPVYKAYEQNNMEVTRWLRVQYPAIRIAAKKSLNQKMFILQLLRF